MPTTILSSKGQVIIPSPIRKAHQWEPGQRFETIDTGDGILLKPAGPFPRTDIKHVACCLHYDGQAKTVQEMNKAIAGGAREMLHDRS